MFLKITTRLLSVKITNSLDQTVWDQSIASYLQPQEDHMLNLNIIN